MNDLEKLMQKIEELRAELNEKGMNASLSDPEIVAASQMLDALLNEYCRLIQRKLK